MYAWATPEYLWEMPILTFWDYLEGVTDEAFRNSWMFAQLQAFIGNALGGKGNKKDSLSKNKAFTPLEFIPPWARPAHLRENPVIPSLLCVAVVEALEAKQIPSWVLQGLSAIQPTDRTFEIAEAVRAPAKKTAGKTAA